jgi:hypothetical protein
MKAIINLIHNHHEFELWRRTAMKFQKRILQSQNYLQRTVPTDNQYKDTIKRDPKDTVKQQ